jgi:hypothetical protein
LLTVFAAGFATGRIGIDDFTGAAGFLLSCGRALEGDFRGLATGFLGIGLLVFAFEGVILATAVLGLVGNIFPAFFAGELRFLPESRPFFEDFEDDFPLLEAMDNSLSHCKSLRAHLRDPRFENLKQCPKQLPIFMGNK